jgi:hypothetical protein
MKKKILFFIGTLLLFSFSLSAGFCQICKKTYPDTFLFCPIHGTLIGKYQVKNIKISGETPIQSTIKVQKNKSKLFNKIISTHEMQILKKNIEDNKYNLSELIALVEKYYKTDKVFVYFLLESLEKKYPENIQVLKLFGDYYMSITNYSEAKNYYKRAEESLNKQIQTLNKN